jgi:hypothetical protein
MKIIYWMFLIVSIGCNFDDNSSLKVSRQVKVHSKDSLEQIFSSKGVITFKNTDRNLDKGFVIYNHDGTIFSSISPKRNEITIIGKKYNLSEYEQSKEAFSSLYNFSPEAFYPEIGFIFQFTFNAIEGGQVEIYIDKNKLGTKFLKADTSIFTIESWEEHLLSSIIDFSDRKITIRQKPSDNAKSANIDARDFAFSVKQIKGDWVEIECASFCDIACPPAKMSGWIRWRNKSEILIRFVYAC